MPGLTLDIDVRSEKHRRLADAIRERVRFSQDKMDSQHKKWRKAEEVAVAFMPERDVDALRRVQRDQGKPQYTTLQVPYSYGLLMAAHTWITTVFLSRDPVFQFKARHGEPEMQVQALEALIDYQRCVGDLMAPLYVYIHDGLKYGLGVTGLFWEDREELIAEIVNEPQSLFGVSTGRFKKRKVTRRIRGYSGNRLYNVRPFDFLPDPRVPISDFQRGEFCAVYIELPWNDILRRQDAGLYTNVKELRRRRTVRDREEGSSVITMPTEDNLPETLQLLSKSERGEVLRGKDVIAAYEVHIDLIPDDWDLGSSKLPEKWVFTITKDFDVILGAQPLGALHNKFPFNVIELEPEGYGLGGRGIPEINKDIQHVIDWLINCYSADTEVLTDRGWVQLPYLRKGEDKIATVDPVSRELRFELPTEYFEREYTGAMVEFDSKRFNCLVTPNHQMLSRKRYKGDWEFAEAQEHLSLASDMTERLLPGSIRWQGQEIASFTVPAAETKSYREYPAREVEMDDWIEFLGHVACDGSVYKGKTSGTYSVRITQRAGLSGAAIRDNVARLPWEWHIYEREQVVGGAHMADITIMDKGLYSWLISNLKTNSYDVRVPTFIKELSPRQLKIFWDACMRTDGSTSKTHPNLQRITSVSKQFIDDLQEIALKLGYSTLINWDENWFDGAWRLSVNALGKDASCTRRDNVESVPYSGKVYCFTNSTHITVTRRKGRVMIAGQSHFYNVRKVLNNQFVVDPSKVMMKDVLDPLPGNIMRLKPSAYGTNPAEAIHQLQVTDVTQTHLRDTQFMIEMAQRALGINDNIMGLINAGGSSRKTAAEVRTSSSFGASRLKTIAEYFSVVGWTPMSQMLVQNSQQYYDQEFKLRLVGDLAIMAGPQFLQVTPEEIQGFYDFVPVDGTLPVDRFAQAALWREMLGQLSKIPAVAAQYDIGKIFAWVAQLAGLKNINQFRVQLAPDAALAAQAQQGNVVPLGGGRQDLTRTPEPGQTSGLGTTG